MVKGDTFEIVYSNILGSFDVGTAKGWPVNEIVSTPGATRRQVFNDKARLWSYSPGMCICNYTLVPIG